MSYEILRDYLILSKIYPDLDKDLKEYDQLYEGLIKSYPPEKLMSTIKMKDPDCVIDYKRSSPGSMMITFNEPKKEIIDKILHDVETFGWFVVMFDIIDKSTRKSILAKAELKQIKDNVKRLSSLEKIKVNLFIEAKYSIDVTEYVLKKFKTLYHITPVKNVKKIMKIGLTPKTRSKLGNHPDRIYLALDMTGIRALEAQFKSKTGTNDWTVLKIDTKKFDGFTAGKLFIDPQFEEHGVFTLSNIDPSYISEYVEKPI